MNESQQNRSSHYENEIDLQDLLRVLWAGKWLIGAIAFATIVIAGIIAMMLPNLYRAEALLAPNDQEGAGGLSALAAQYGGLASLAGINLGSSASTDKTAIGLEILKSRRFLSDFIGRRGILIPLIAAKEWDSETGLLIIDSDDYDVEKSTWVRDATGLRKIIPSSQEAYEAFQEILSVRQDKKTGLVTIAVIHISPLIAKEWVDWLVSDLNSFVMRQDVEEAERSIEFLNEQIQKTSITNLQDVFFNLIEEQSKTVMLAKVSDEYLLKTLDPAVVPERKAEPHRLMIIFLSALLSLMLAVVIVLIRAASSRSAKHIVQRSD